MTVVGIDLGTTNTVVACARGGRVEVLADEQGRRLLPSVVSFHPNGEVLVGHAAKERRVVDGRNTIASVKRLIGRAWDSEEIARARDRFAFELRDGPGHGPLVVARGREYTLPEISAFVLRRAKQLAEAALGEEVARAVVTVPANFNELQRAATKVAGRVAGLDVIRIINEPTAAALAYGLGRTTRERIVVYDFGGGTFDCTLLDLSTNVFEVLATGGDTFLGGDDLDLAIAERMAEAFLAKHRLDPRSDPQVFERLRVGAETIKIQLSTAEHGAVSLPEVASGAKGAPLGLDFTMSRQELERLAAPLVERTFTVCEDAVAISRLPVTAFEKVVLVGGSTRIPLVRRRVAEFFGGAPLDRLNVEEVVAIGAAIQAAALTELARRRSVPAPPVPAGRAASPSVPPTALPSFPPADGPHDEVTVTTRLPAQLAELQRMYRRSSTPASPLDEPEPDSTDLPALPTVTPFAPSVADGPADVDLPPQRPPTRTMPLVASPGPQQASSVRPTTPLRPPAEGLPGLPPVQPRPGGTQAVPLPPMRPQASTQPILQQPPTPLHALVPTMALPHVLPTPPPAAPPPVLVDVTPHALVVETAGGWCDVIVPRNSKIPCERTRAFSTSSDLQTTVEVRVAQGSDPAFDRNTYLGKVELAGIRAAARGEVTIQVRFDVDESGTLNVFAMDVATAREAHALLQLVGIAGPPSIHAMHVRQTQQIAADADGTIRRR